MLHHLDLKHNNNEILLTWLMMLDISHPITFGPIWLDLHLWCYRVFHLKKRVEMTQKLCSSDLILIKPKRVCQVPQSRKWKNGLHLVVKHILALPLTNFGSEMHCSWVLIKLRLWEWLFYSKMSFLFPNLKWPQVPILHAIFSHPPPPGPYFVPSRPPFFSFEEVY